MRQLSIHPSNYPTYRPIRTSIARVPSCSTSHGHVCKLHVDAKLFFSAGPKVSDSDVAITTWGNHVWISFGASDRPWWATIEVQISKEWVDVDGWLVGGSRIEKSKKSKRTWLSRSDLQAKKWWRSTCLATWLNPIWLSRPFVGVEQSWWSLQRCDAGSRTLRPQNLVIACVYPNPHCHPDVDPCSCLPISSSAGWSSAVGSDTLRP